MSKNKEIEIVITVTPKGPGSCHTNAQVQTNDASWEEAKKAFEASRDYFQDLIDRAEQCPAKPKRTCPFAAKVVTNENTDGSREHIRTTLDLK